MSVDQIPTRQSPRKDDSKLVRYEDFIESKIQSTRWMVKAVDLATALVMLVASVLAYLLVVAVAEHWIVPGGFSVAARTALCAILVIGIGYFVYQRIWPLLVRAINPVYAARAIEQGSPSLKNSLINLLFFRDRRAGISDAVYRTLEEQAAQRLTRVPVETSVDRTLLIRLGYVLVGVVAIAGLYKVFSPKDPLVSAERILFPWADIVPASRVTITAVTPGSLTVSRGEFVDVSAEVHGLGDDDAMVLRYTTDDGQVVGKPIPMKPAGDGLRYACRVADEADGSAPVGLTRSLKYRLEAGDARSLDYAIKVVSAPSILVEHVDYHYPPYTGYVDRTVDGLGDIRAIEGTRMTIHARANGEIRNADVDFDADGRPDLRMTAKEIEANASFELGLREDRQTPRHASYVLRFTNDEGRTNRDPVKHSIAVDRDYDPEASVLSPKEKAIDARLDETVAIEVEASDPDFKLSAVRLHGEAAGHSVLDESLLKAEHRGRFTSRYSFVPNAHGLKAGDVVKYWIEASDNRTPRPNTVTTAKEERTIRIVSPNPGQQPPPDRVARNDRQQPKPGADQEGGQQEQGGQQGGKNQGEKNQDKAAGQKDNADQQQGEQKGENQQGGGEASKGGQQNSDKQQGGGEGNKNGEQKADNQQQSKGDSKSGGEAKGENAQGGEQKGNKQESGEKGQSGSPSKSSDGSSDQQQSKGEQTGAGASGSQSSKDAARPDGARPDQGKKQEGETGRGGDGEKSKQQQGEKQSKPGDQKTAVSSEGDNDGEAFERIQKHMEQSGDLKKDEKSNSDAGQSAVQKQVGTKQKGEKSQEAGKNKSQGESKSDESKSANGESASADGKSDTKPGNANQKQQSDGQSKDQKQGAGAKPNGDDKSQTKDQKSDGAGEQKKSPEGQESGSTGPGGAGDEKQPQGSPNSQPDKKPVEKHQQSGSKEGTNKQEPPAGANGKKESDSSGDQGGDKSGGGEEGAGQKAPREGTGSAGDHQSADNGTGESTEKGKGDKSSSGGKDAKSDHPTGSSDGKTPGKGSQQKDGSGNKSGGSAGNEIAQSQGGENAAGEKGDKAGSKEGEAKGTESKVDQEGKQADKQQQKDGKEVGKQGDQKGGEAGKKQEGAEQGKSSGPTEGGGVPGGVPSGPTTTGSAPEGDAANLEYARKQTDLVLDKLANQLSRNKVDDRMLKELGWTRDDLRRFVERWQQRKDAAQLDDPKGEAAKRELDDALRSLGLQRDKLQQNAVQKDSMRDLKQGYRGPVPLEYQERLRAYNQGVSRANREGE